VEEIKIKYNRSSAKRQNRRDRLQLLSASFGIIVGLSETWKVLTGFLLIIPVLSLILAIANIVIAKSYNRFQKKYGEKFDILLFKLNGIVMLLTGLIFHLNGAQYIQYCYYVISIAYFIIFPYFLVPSKKKKLILQINDSGIIVHNLFLNKSIYLWQDVKSILLQHDLLQIKTMNHGRGKKYFFQHKETIDQLAIASFINRLKLTNNYSFEIIENINGEKN
jgi:hypothetical protein